MHLQDAKMQAPDMLVPYRDSFTSSQPGVLHQSKRVRSVQTLRLLLLSVHQLVWMGSLDMLEHSMSFSSSLVLLSLHKRFMGMPTLCATACDAACSVTLPSVLSRCAGLSSGHAYHVHPLPLVLLHCILCPLSSCIASFLHCI